MRKLGFTAVAVVAALACAVPASAAAAAGPAAGPAGWRVAAVLDGPAPGGLWAGGAKDAWLAGDECAPLSCPDEDTPRGTVVVRHWDGTSWRKVTPPKAYVDSRLDQGAGPVAATSAHDAWVFTSRGNDEVSYTDALHWNGRSWGKPVRMSGGIEAAVAVSPAQVWAFGSPDTLSARGYYAHFNGKSWKAGLLPVEGQAAAAGSASDVWVGGSSAPGAIVIDHWDGHAWHLATVLAAGSAVIAWVTGITVLGPSDVWASIDTSGRSSSSAATVLEHWNGTRWQRVKVPVTGEVSSAGVVPDGHGGLWVAIGSQSSSNSRPRVAHYSAGHWTVTSIAARASAPYEPPCLQQLAWIPGTRSLWATAYVETANLGTAVLFYG